MFWGDAGIGLSIMGTSLAVAAIFGQGSGEAVPLEEYDFGSYNR